MVVKVDGCGGDAGCGSGVNSFDNFYINMHDTNPTWSLDCRDVTPSSSSFLQRILPYITKYNLEI